ncbi:WXG100 family type VII secretion target [Streptomyces sp. NPDC020412]|uniref:WXG100 family type VII secretion target n=1 Tax=Streptomyces sp. NPDC020412 TaxID=3365073 RepID=UPI0037B6C03B
MAGVQKVGDQSLKDFQDEISRQFDDIKGQVQQLQGVIDSLEGRWKGIGAGAFDGKQAEINQGMVRIAKLLADFQEAIAVTRTTAASTDEDVRASMQSVDASAGAGASGGGGGAPSSKLAAY